MASHEAIVRWCRELAKRQVAAAESRATFASDMYFEAADAIEKLRAALEPFAAEPLSTEPEHNRTMLFSFADQDDKIRRAREALSN